MMRRQIIADQEGLGIMGVPLVEPAIVPDTFVSELHDVEDLGERVFRFTFVTNQKSVIDGKDEKVISLRVVITASAVLRASTWALRAIGYRCYCAALKVVK
jgi:hypothetical protein